MSITDWLFAIVVFLFVLTILYFIIVGERFNKIASNTMPIDREELKQSMVQLIISAAGPGFTLGLLQLIAAFEPQTITFRSVVGNLILICALTFISAIGMAGSFFYGFAFKKGQFLENDVNQVMKNTLIELLESIIPRKH